MAFWWIDDLACCSLFQPGLDFLLRDVKSGVLKILPGGDGVLIKLIATLLSLNELLDGEEKELFGRLAASASELLYRRMELL